MIVDKISKTRKLLFWMKMVSFYYNQNKMYKWSICNIFRRLGFSNAENGQKSKTNSSNFLMLCANLPNYILFLNLLKNQVSELKKILTEKALSSISATYQLITISHDYILYYYQQ